MKKKVLIMGAAGFLGSSLWETLLAKKQYYNIFGIDTKFVSTSKRNICCNINNRKKFQEILSEIKPDIIFHLAGGRVNDKERLFEGNFLTTQSLFEALSESRLKATRVIVPGTAAEYGKMDANTKIIKEDFVCKPASWYGFVKYMQTTLALVFAQRGFNVIIARMFNVLGHRTPPTLSIGHFAREISLIESGKKENIIRTRNLDGKRDFLDINDVCSALMAVATKGKSGEVYNICSSRAYTVRDLLCKLFRHAKVKRINIQENKGSVSESYDSVGSNRKIKRDTNWKPRVSMDLSLKNTLHYYRTILQNK